MREISRRIIFASLCLGTFACASSGSEVGSPNRLHQVLSGAELEVEDYFFVSENCQPIPFTLRVTSPARHGTLIVRPGTRTLAGKISTIGEKNKKCDGLQVDSRQLIYQSRIGYVGQDNFEIYVITNLKKDQPRFVPYRINVVHKR